MTFTVVPTWIDPNLSNNADRVLIGAGAPTRVPAAQSVALRAHRGQPDAAGGQDASRTRSRSARPGRRARPRS